jgi:glyoxylase-like metal-dependent hydrolase (beta-lactamase superfamily II)
MTAPISVFEDGGVRITKVGPMGPGQNNAYIVRDLGRDESLLVDMPVEEEPLLAAIAADGKVKRIVATHWHPDHWMTYDAVRSATNAPVLVGAREVNIPEERIDGRLDDGAEILLGSTRITVLHTPGHTPGSICLRLGRAVISGDTLFNGGPGRTFASGDLEVLIDSIADRLLPLPPDTAVMPGHGSDTTIGESRRQFAVYQRHPQASGYHGDVAWITGAALSRG